VLAACRMMVWGLVYPPGDSPSPNFRHHPLPARTRSIFNYHSSIPCESSKSVSIPENVPLNPTTSRTLRCSRRSTRQTGRTGGVSMLKILTLWPHRLTQLHRPYTSSTIPEVPSSKSTYLLQRSIATQSTPTSATSASANQYQTSAWYPTFPSNRKSYISDVTSSTPRPYPHTSSLEYVSSTVATPKFAPARPIASQPSTSIHIVTTVITTRSMISTDVFTTSFSTSVVSSVGGKPVESVASSGAGAIISGNGIAVVGIFVVIGVLGGVLL
jgi:hypothetical protein